MHFSTLLRSCFSRWGLLKILSCTGPSCTYLQGCQGNQIQETFVYVIASKPNYLQTWMFWYVCSYIHIYIYTYVHTYIHSKCVRWCSTQCQSRIYQDTNTLCAKHSHWSVVACIHTHTHTHTHTTSSSHRQICTHTHICDILALQGDLERSLEAPISPMCDRHENCGRSSQKNFIITFVRPLFSLCGSVLPDVSANTSSALTYTACCLVVASCNMHLLSCIHRYKHFYMYT